MGGEVVYLREQVHNLLPFILTMPGAGRGRSPGALSHLREYIVYTHHMTDQRIPCYVNVGTLLQLLWQPAEGRAALGI